MKQQFLIGQRVIVGPEIGTIQSAEQQGRNVPSPFDHWVFLPSRGYAGCYADANVKPLPHGQL